MHLREGPWALRRLITDQGKTTPEQDLLFHHLKKRVVWFRVFRKHIMIEQMSKMLTVGVADFCKQGFHHPCALPTATEAHSYRSEPTPHQCHHHRSFELIKMSTVTDSTPIKRVFLKNQTAGPYSQNFHLVGLGGAENLHFYLLSSDALRTAVLGKPFAFN